MPRRRPRIGAIHDVEAAPSTHAPEWAPLLPRFLAHGVDHSDFVRTTAGIESWAGWLDAWVAAGDVHREIAEEAEARGRLRSAGEAYVRAAVYYHYAKFLWLEDLAKYRATTGLAVATLRRGMPLLDPSFERIEIPFEGDRLVANLRRPAGDIRPPGAQTEARSDEVEHPGPKRGVPPSEGRNRRSPVVVLVPGLDSTKEEFPLWEETFLRRGLATVSLDGPGQGEAGLVLPIRPDFEVPVAALLDVLERRSDLDMARVGISGVGMGGYYAARAAAFEPRILAVGVVGAPYRFPHMPPRTKRKFMHGAHLDDEDAARAFAERFTLDGVASLVAQPYLVIHGRHDAVMTPEEADLATRAAPRRELRIYPDGNTVCQSVSHLVRPYLADWLRERTAGTDPARRSH